MSFIMNITHTIYKDLKEAHLTHPFHCCAFQYPEQHDPKGFKQHQEYMEKLCEEFNNNLDTGQHKSKRSLDYWANSVE